jgi:hypothetical protein
MYKREGKFFKVKHLRQSRLISFAVQNRLFLVCLRQTTETDATY